MSHWHWLKFGCPRTSSQVPPPCCALLDSLRVSFLLFAVHLSSHLPFHSLDHLHLPCGWQEPCALLIMGREQFSHRLWAQRPPLSETTDVFIQESCSDGNLLNLHDLEFDDYTIGMALSSPLFTQEREDAASRGQDYHSLDEGLWSSQSSSVGHVRTGRLVLGSLIPNVRETPRRDFENEQIRTLLERQKEQILADYQA